IDYLNPAAVREFGHSEGQKCFFYFEERREPCPRCSQLRVLQGETSRWEYFSGRNQKTYEFSNTPLQNPDGSLSRLSIFRDITDSKRAEEALRESEKKYRDLFEESFDGLFITSPAGKILEMNKKGIVMFGYDTKEEVLSLDLAKDVYADPLDRKWILEYINSVGSGEYEVAVKRKNGATILTHCALTAEKDEEGKVIRYRGIIRDITARKLAEERQEYLMRRLKAIWEIARMVDVSSRRLCDHVLTEALAMTNSSYGFFGFLTEDETIQNVYSWSHEVMSDCRVGDGPIEFSVAQAGLWAEAVRRRKALLVNDYHAELPGKKGIPAGHVNLHRLLVVPIFSHDRIVALTAVANKADDYTEDDSEQVAAFVTSAMVILQKRQAEEELVSYRDHLEDLVKLRTAELTQANIRLQELDRLKSMFIASMSHELRTPLNTIIGFTGMTLDGLSGPLNEEQEDNLGRVYRSSRHLLNLITDVIDISKIEAGRINIYPEQLMLDELVSEAVDAVQPQLKDKGLTLEVDAPAGLTIITDRKRLLQCLLNFLSNAVKFTEAGKVAVSVREVNGQFEISVSDTGIGIAEQDLPRLFEAFERLDSHLRVKAGGTGLGLYLTKKLATEVLSGSVAVESTEGKGSTFRIRVPKMASN
ncbi:MAG: PAS domain S-box protein, partial [Deltaproteobacteria bacterium]|nr:PAS domain S-box protein [Deltaproteobacteria bacterium]